MRITDTHIYFWGSYLSNWFKCSFKDEQYTYLSSEAYLMAQKALLFNDIASAEKIVNTNDPKKQKVLGRQVKGFKDDIWNKHKFNLMVKGLILKFEQNSNLKEQLIKTENKILVEGSPYDKIWGVGLHYDDDLILNEKNWLGENLLGKALMKTRDILKTQNGDKLKDFKELNNESTDFINSENFGDKLLESVNEALLHFKGEKKLRTVEIKQYDKLIRDKIPQTIYKSKKICETFNEKDKNKLIKYYLKKLEEELKEVMTSKTKKELIEELADLAEVLDGLLINLNLKESVLKIKEDKKNEKGGFSNLILKYVRSELHDWFFLNEDEFRTCKKCGLIETDENANGNCLGEDEGVFENLEIGMKDVEAGNGISSSELKEKLKLNNFLFREINGSILDAKEDIIAQGCNCEGSSNFGLAKYLANEYPKSDKIYQKMCSNNLFHLGTVLFNKEKGKIQAFCGTQNYYGKFLKMDKKSIEERYQAIETCLIKIYNKAKNEKLSVALPRIGCGLARGDWERVKVIIKRVFHDYPVTIYWIPDNKK